MDHISLIFGFQTLLFFLEGGYFLFHDYTYRFFYGNAVFPHRIFMVLNQSLARTRGYIRENPGGRGALAGENE